MKGIKRRLVKGINANIFGQCVNVITQFVSVPIYLHAWGISLYGEWLALNTLPAYLAMSDIGFASVAGNQMTMQVSSGDQRSSLVTYQSSALVLMFSCVVVLAMPMINFELPLGNWFNLMSFTNDELTKTLFMLALGVVINLQMNLLGAGFRCIGQYALNVWIVNVIRLIEFLIITVALWFKATPFEVVSITALIRILGYGVSQHLLARSCPWLRYGYRYASWKQMKILTPAAFGFMGFPIGNALKSQGMLSIVSITLGPVATVTFNTHRTLINVLFQAMNVINNAVWPEFSAAFGAENLELARKLHRISCKASLWIGITGLLLLYFAGEWLLQVWTHGNVPFNRLLFVLMEVSMAFNSLWFTSSVVQISSNTHGVLALLYLLSAVIAGFITYTLIQAYGLNATAIGLIILEIILVVYVLPTSLRQVNDRGWRFLAYIINPFCWMPVK